MPASVRVTYQLDLTDEQAKAAGQLAADLGYHEAARAVMIAKMLRDHGKNYTMERINEAVTLASVRALTE